MAWRSALTWAVCFCGVWAWTTVAAVADLTLKGPEIQAHTTTLHDQLGPDVTASTGGGFVVGWTHVRQDAGENRDIFLRRFDADGLPLTVEMPSAVVSDRSSSGLHVLESDASGDLVMGFTSQILCCDFYTNALFKRFSASGVEKEAARLFRTVMGHDTVLGGVGVAPDGSFLLGWSVSFTAPVEFRGAFTRFVDASGTADAEETEQDSEVLTPFLAASPLGGFLMYLGGEAFWMAADGSTTGPGIPLNLQPATDIWQVKLVVLPSGNGVIVWTHHDFGTGTSEIFARRVAPDGTLLGPIALLTRSPIPGFTTQDVAVVANGGYVVVWERAAVSGGARNIYARQFQEDGTPLSAEILVNPSDFGDERTPRVAAIGENDLVVVWQNVDGQDGDEGGIYGQRLALLPDPFFVDGFESGDTSSWSATVP